MAPKLSRQALFETMENNPPDIVIAGGGITGAGIFREAAMAGLRVLLLEGMDFGWGASSSSSKLIHGGLRYLQTGRFDITYRAVQERDLLVRELPGLIEPLDLLLPAYSFKRKMIFGLGLWIYDRFARRRSHQTLRSDEILSFFPTMRQEGLRGGYIYRDAITDDARLVMRVLHDGAMAGGHALNYAAVKGLLQTEGSVTGVLVEDRLTGASYTIRSRAVINATGFNADALRAHVGQAPRLRPLRGSHLVFSKKRIPLEKAIVFDHPNDGRSIFLLPWQGQTAFGTTEMDDKASTTLPPVITEKERSYLLHALGFLFPQLGITERDIISSWAGVRPIVSHGKKNTYKEPREMFIRYEHGLLTATGGKLTTFRYEAVKALRLLGSLFPALRKLQARPFESGQSETSRRSDALGGKRWLDSAYGAKVSALEQKYVEGDQDLGGMAVAKAIVRFALEDEWVEHLDDLMLRRTRLGFILPQGGAAILPEIRALCLEAGWSKERFADEEARYLRLFQDAYAPIPRGFDTKANEP